MFYLSNILDGSSTCKQLVRRRWIGRDAMKWWQKQGLVAIAFPRLESGVIEAEVRGAKGDRFDGVRNGWRVSSRIEDALGISRVFDRVDDRESQGRGRISFLNNNSNKLSINGRDLNLTFVIECRFTPSNVFFSTCSEGEESFQSRSSKSVTLKPPPLKFIGSLHFLFFANFLSRFIPRPIINPLSIMSPNGSIMRRDCWL